MIVGFGLMQGDADPGNQTWVRQQVARLFSPMPRSFASDWHNWVHDPFSRGALGGLPRWVSSLGLVRAFGRWLRERNKSRCDWIDQPTGGAMTCRVS
jgi:hypothetical protein